VASRFFRKFDIDYDTWIKAIRIVAQLDCLVSLAKASASLGQPSCRPQFVDEERSVVEFEELRHPCMINTVGDFIPNDIKLGGEEARISLLTGANAAGKSTVLRMVSPVDHLLSCPVRVKLTTCSLASQSSWPRLGAMFPRGQLS
jgi:DNA mismatch repair protein MSH6